MSMPTSLKTGWATNPFYWGWWISWSPFVGMFVARPLADNTRVCAGRATDPGRITFIWLSIFGNSALPAELSERGEKSLRP